MAQVWVEAARPRTLPLSIAPVLVGTAAAGRFIPLRFLAAIGVSVGLQIGVNFANDYFDARSGVDTPDRVGPRRVTAAGLVTPEAMRRATLIALSLAAICGSLLAWAVGPELIGVGVVCIVAGLAYSGGPKPYASAGMGEVSVFIFFGLVATAGSAYVQVEELRALFVVAGAPLGLLACSVLVVNNLRDIATDEPAGKRTLAVRLGRGRTVLLYRTLLAGAFISLTPIAVLDRSLWTLLPLIAAVVAWELKPALSSTLRLYIAFAALLAIGLVLP